MKLTFDFRSTLKQVGIVSSESEFSHRGFQLNFEFTYIALSMFQKKKKKIQLHNNMGEKSDD